MDTDSLELVDDSLYRKATLRIKRFSRVVGVMMRYESHEGHLPVECGLTLTPALARELARVLTTYADQLEDGD